MGNSKSKVDPTEGKDPVPDDLETDKRQPEVDDEQDDNDIPSIADGPESANSEVSEEAPSSEQPSSEGKPPSYPKEDPPPYKEKSSEEKTEADSTEAGSSAQSDGDNISQGSTQIKRAPSKSRSEEEITPVSEDEDEPTTSRSKDTESITPIDEDEESDDDDEEEESDEDNEDDKKSDPSETPADAKEREDQEAQKRMFTNFSLLSKKSKGSKKVKEEIDEETGLSPEEEAAQLRKKQQEHYKRLLDSSTPFIFDKSALPELIEETVSPFDNYDTVGVTTEYPKWAISNFNASGLVQSPSAMSKMQTNMQYFAVILPFIDLSADIFSAYLFLSSNLGFEKAVGLAVAFNVIVVPSFQIMFAMIRPNDVEEQLMRELPDNPFIRVPVICAVIALGCITSVMLQCYEKVKLVDQMTTVGDDEESKNVRAYGGISLIHFKLREIGMEQSTQLTYKLCMLIFIYFHQNQDITSVPLSTYFIFVGKRVWIIISGLLDAWTIFSTILDSANMLHIFRRGRPMSFVSQFLRLVHITMSILMGSVIGFLILHIGFRDERWKWKRVDMEKKGEKLYVLMGILLFIFVPMLTMIINMISLYVKSFKQKWISYDIRMKYGIYQGVIQLNFLEMHVGLLTPKDKVSLKTIMTLVYGTVVEIVTWMFLLCGIAFYRENGFYLYDASEHVYMIDNTFPLYTDTYFRYSLGQKPSLLTAEMNILISDMPHTHTTEDFIHYPYQWERVPNATHYYDYYTHPRVMGDIIKNIDEFGFEDICIYNDALQNVCYKNDTINENGLEVVLNNPFFKRKYLECYSYIFKYTPAEFRYDLEAHAEVEINAYGGYYYKWDKQLAMQDIYSKQYDKDNLDRMTVNSIDQNFQSLESLRETVTYMNLMYNKTIYWEDNYVKANTVMKNGSVPLPYFNETASMVETLNYNTDRAVWSWGTFISIFIICPLIGALSRVLDAKYWELSERDEFPLWVWTQIVPMWVRRHSSLWKIMVKLLFCFIFAAAIFFLNKVFSGLLVEEFCIQTIFDPVCVKNCSTDATFTGDKYYDNFDWIYFQALDGVSCYQKIPNNSHTHGFLFSTLSTDRIRLLKREHNDVLQVKRFDENSNGNDEGGDARDFDWVDGKDSLWRGYHDIHFQEVETAVKIDTKRALGVVSWVTNTPDVPLNVHLEPETIFFPKPQYIAAVNLTSGIMWDATEDFGNDKEIIYKFSQSCHVQYGDIWLGLNTDEGEIKAFVPFSIVRMGHFPIRKMADARHICDTHTQHILYCLDDGDEKVVPEYQVRCYVINHDFTEYFLIPNRIIPRDQSEYEMAYDELRIADDDVIIVQRAKRVIHFNLMRYMNNTEHHHQKTYWDYQWEWRNQYTTCHNRVCYMLAENVIQSAGGKRENRNGLMVFNLDVFPYIQKRMLHPAAADMIPSLDREIQMPLRLVPVYHRHNVRDDLMPLGQIQGTVYIRGADTYFMGMKMKEEKIYSFNCSFVSSASLKVTNDTRSRLLTNCFEYKKEHKGVNDTFDYLQYSTDETLVIDQYNLNYRKFISYPKRRKGWLARPEMRLDAVRADVKRAKEDRDNPDKTRCYFQRPNCTVTCDDYENENRLFKVCKHVEPDWTQPMEILGESSIYDFPHRKLPYDRAFNRHYMGKC